MGESFLAGSEYRDSSTKEITLKTALAGLVGKRWQISLKNDEITVLVETELTINEVVRHENRIETGHLTLDDVYFELVNNLNIKIFLPLVQFRSAEVFGPSHNLYFDSYWWMFRAL